MLGFWHWCAVYIWNFSEKSKYLTIFLTTSSQIISTYGIDPRWFTWPKRCFTLIFLQCNHWLTDNNSSKRSAGYYTMKTNILKWTGCIWFRWQVIKHCNSFWGKNHFTKKTELIKSKSLYQNVIPISEPDIYRVTLFSWEQFLTSKKSSQLVNEFSTTEISAQPDLSYTMC